mgnify:CR=1 FL=1
MNIVLEDITEKNVGEITGIYNHYVLNTTASYAIEPVTVGGFLDYYKINDKLQGKAEDGEYSKLFDKTKVNTIKINIPENNWNYLIENAFDKPSVLIDSISINDYEIKSAGMKTKGNSSLNGLHNSKNNRFSFRSIYGSKGK